MIDGKSIIAIVPARAGSKGLLGKNYRDVGGRPLIGWTLEAATRSDLIDKVVVSTNCPQVIEIAETYPEDQVEVIRRPDRLSKSSSKTEDAMRHVLDLQKNEFDIVLLLQPTSPARRDNLIDNCIMRMLLSKSDSVLTVSTHTPFFWRIDDAGKAVPTYENKKRPMRQSLKPTDFYYHDTGNVYGTYAETFRVYGRYGTNPVLYPTPLFESMQIDTLEDVIAMESLAKVYGGFI